MADIHYREGTPDDDRLASRNSLNKWLAMGVPERELTPEAFDNSLHFIAAARQKLQFRSFIADADGVAVGSACCQLHAGLFPAVFGPKR